MPGGMCQDVTRWDDKLALRLCLAFSVYGRVCGPDDEDDDDIFSLGQFPELYVARAAWSQNPEGTGWQMKEKNIPHLVRVPMYP